MDYEELLESIPDEMVELPHTKSGLVKLNRRSVFKMATQGWTVVDISKTFGINDQTVAKYLGKEIALGKGTIAPMLKAQILRHAMSSDPKPAILIFAAKAFAGMTEEGLREDIKQNDTVEFTVRVPKGTVVKGMSELKTIEGEDAN